MDEIGKLADRHGFELLGVGSTRFGVAISDQLVAKLSWDVLGLALSVNEAAACLAAPPRIRRCFVDSKALTDRLVLLTERVAPISPTITTTAGADSIFQEGNILWTLASQKWLGPVNELRRRLGLEPNTTHSLRTDNYGLNSRGQVVALDFGQFSINTMPEAWRWLHLQSQRGDVRINDAARHRFQRQLRKRGGRRLLASYQPTLRELAAQAGWEMTDAQYGSYDARLRSCSQTLRTGR